MSEEQIILTPEGLEKLKQELHELKSVKRKEAAERIESAKALGDLSENAEYQEAKENSAWIEGRIIELSNLLTRATVVSNTSSSDIVTVGKTVVIRNGHGNKTYTIVGANEADPIHGRISSSSPLANALLGGRINDEVEVHTPGGVQKYQIIKIE